MLLYSDPEGERLLELLITAGPFAAAALTRMVVGRSKELGLAMWLTGAWLILRGSMSAQMPFLKDLFNVIEEIIRG